MKTTYFDMISKRAMKENIPESMKPFWRTKICEDLRRSPCYIYIAYKYCMRNKAKKCEDILRDFLNEQVPEGEQDEQQ